MHNFASIASCTALHEFPKGLKLEEIFGNRIYARTPATDAPIELDGFGYRWFRIEP
jgi:maltose alpha-D-glucosyltransferase/alpha-amylase